MDRPLGPRQPPDKRNTAYEDIFGRPGASHHTPQIYAPPAQPYPYQHPTPVVDKRTSYTSLAPSYLNQPFQGPSSIYRQSFYTPPVQHAHPSYPQPIPGSYGYPNTTGPTNPALARARSTISNAPVNGVIRHDEPPNSSHESLTHPGLTPAQAYQAQIYMNSPAGSQTDWNKYQSSPGPSSRPHSSHTQNGASPFPGDPPRLGVSLDHDDGRLGLDFGMASGNSSDQGTDDGSSELPWARNERPASVNPPSRSNTQTHRQSEPVYPLHDSGPAPSIRSSITSTSPTSLMDQSMTLVDHVSTTSARRSSESARTMPRFSGARRDRTGQDRSMSMSAATPSVRTVLDQKRASRPPIPPSSIHEGRHSPASVRPVRKSPIVYPALLSRVAEAFRDRIPLADRLKDGLTYKDAFDGREAVDKVAYIIKTTDRNLALLLGRALDAQKFFHDVTYDHRLRDTANELYQFRTKLPSPFVSGELPNGEDSVLGHPNGKELPPIMGADSSAEEKDGVTGQPSHTRPRKGSIVSDDVPLPSGVFTLLTDCYSPTCSRDQLCYSIACPRRLEQQARLNMKPQPGLSKQISRESLGDVAEPGTLWIHSVPQEIVNSVSDAEKKRQEAINEVIYTERDFVRDMEYLRDTWVGRLKDNDIIPADRRADFLAQVFWNIHDIIAVNTRFRDALNKRQKQYAVVERIGDIFIDAVPHFAPFVSYGAHQLYGKYEFEKEKSSNPAFAQFVETTERLPESRKLELNAYLTKPTTRLARYPLLLEAVLKHTPADSPDKTALPQAVAIVRGFLKKVNEESGKSENRFNLMQLEQQLYFKPGEEVDLRLKEEGRQLVGKDSFNKRDGEIQVYLFDHAIVFTKPVKTKQHEQFRVYRRPIPLELLLISAPEDPISNTSRLKDRNRQGLVKKTSFTRERGMPLPPVPAKPDVKGQHWINFMHLGRKYYNLILWAPSPVVHRRWVELITKQQQQLRERSLIFDTVTLSDGFFYGPNKVNCAAPFNGGRKIVYGTNDGVYISDLRESNREPVRVLALLDVLQVDVLEDYQLLIVLSERQVITFPLDALDPNDPMAGLKRAKRISSHTSFFKAGFCLGRVLVCIVKSSQLSSTFKTLEPIDQNIRGRSKPTFRKLLQGGNDTLKLFREFYIPVESTSIHYLKTKMCVGCSRGFEIVDLESLDTQGLLDPNDESLEFVRKRENLRPMAIYRIHNEFLLCYDEFAFYVNKNGRRSRKEFMVHWEGTPTGFALHEPYVLAFEAAFVEIRHIETGLMSQVIQGSNLRLLFADTPPSVTNTVSPVPQPGYPAAYEYNGPYASPPTSGSSHGSTYGGYGPPPPPHHQYMNPYPPPSRNPQGIGRDEILIVSDDRVLALRTAAGPQRRMSDSASMMSMPR
ncbi:Rho1 guanine nucleotide exchange factor 1 [Hypsizygus marmoreus]|uniref:Rho1 guanine nucleotide exchange factor 1 n=1 Tax=Hypsizygus marmoreus TaxID=39966 RepID=A0A369JX45_HYPMA|nr:Rho1 guanine nucleotide exchange factor 1 [Hypsizygus marmoreus]